MSGGCIAIIRRTFVQLCHDGLVNTCNCLFGSLKKIQWVVSISCNYRNENKVWQIVSTKIT